MNRTFLLGILSLAVTLSAQTPLTQPPQNPPAGAQQPQPGRGGGRGGGGGGRGVQVMTLATTAWTDGGTIPAKHAQNGGEVSPALSWGNVPEGVGSFVLIVRDLDAPARSARGSAGTDLLHWLVWNIPGTARNLKEGIPHESELPDGARQIGATGPGYRGPAAPADGPPHHYVFELYALDTPIDVPAVGASPDETRAAVFAAMANKVRGKASLVGTFKRGT
jgi:Raf kinase inhibitor-like YbhB/YbcL family protein